ncbi:MAG: FAD binding domain-containing protein [Hyphomicrobiales bacterium]
MLSCDQYLMPESLEEALHSLAGASDGVRLVAGATDILPWAREGRAGDVHIPTLVDVSNVRELSGYEISDGQVRIGANVPYQSFLTDADLREHMPCMPYCAVWFADDQIRQQATLIGNIVNASPAADGTPPVIAMNGTIAIARLDGKNVAVREMAVADFVLGPGKTQLEPSEIVVAVTCRSMKGYGGSFQKVGQRRSLVISAACVAGLVRTNKSGTQFEDVRLALGGVGPVPERLTDVEEALKGKPISAELIKHACAHTGDKVASRTRRAYRRTVVRGFVEAAILDALADCGVQLNFGEIKEAANA